MDTKRGQQLYICCLFDITVVKIKLAHYRPGQTLKSPAD